MGMSPQQQPQQQQQQGMMAAGAMMYNGYHPYSGEDRAWDVQLNAVSSSFFILNRNV